MATNMGCIDEGDACVIVAFFENNITRHCAVSVGFNGHAIEIPPSDVSAPTEHISADNNLSPRAFYYADEWDTSDHFVVPPDFHGTTDDPVVRSWLIAR